MSENKSNIENIELINAGAFDTTEKLSAREIFERISELQKQITENSYYSLHRLGDTFSSLYDHDGVTAASEEIEVVCSVFKEREKTLMKMLEIYERMYEDLCVSSPEMKSIELLKISVAAEIELIKSSGLPADRRIKMKTEAIEKGRTTMTDVILRSQDASKQTEASKAPEPEAPQSNDQ